ncbi:phosphatases II [Rickenella mellea]|uniref:Phosphatases II n=1 Tax=Rickenella mellea TaxID=50990 RepID=A0A4Y7PZR8_9AGAM|nr:phosphatases II [Rickenella mellea]
MPVCPAWITNATKSPSYVDTCMNVLDKRERLRDYHRRLSHARATEAAAPSTRGRFTFAPRQPSVPSSDELKEYAVSESSKLENQRANRYMDIEPYDRTRVIVDDERYLNANWVRERYGGKWWIASQAPLPSTAHAFLSAILQSHTRPLSALNHPHFDASSSSKIRTIVQLTVGYEGGRIKAHSYFPSEVGRAYLVPPEDGCGAAPLEITLVDRKEIDVLRCVQSTVHLVRQGYRGPDTSVTFQHLLYAAWPDFGVPEPDDRLSLLRFARYVERVNRDTSLQPDHAELDPEPPIIVGCSAGVGRTGAFITMSSLLRAHGLLLPEQGEAALTSLPPLPASPLGPLELPPELSGDEVVQEIDSLREQRMAMVQRREQVQLIYGLVRDAFDGL